MLDILGKTESSLIGVFAIRKLNSIGGSICLDLLSEEQLQQLIDTQSEEVA